LARHEHELADADRLRVRRALERRGSSLGADDGLLHDASYLLGLQAWASETPSALKIASSTCWVSPPFSSRTCIVSPAPSASWRRKRATRSVSRPPTRAAERSTFETRSGRPDASSETCASASSAGTTAEPIPRTPSARSAA